MISEDWEIRTALRASARPADSLAGKKAVSARVRRSRRRRRVGWAAASGILALVAVLAGLEAYQQLRPEPRLVITDQEIDESTGTVRTPATNTPPGFVPYLPQDQNERLLSNWLRAGRGPADIFLPLTNLSPHEQPSFIEMLGGRRGYRLNYEVTDEGASSSTGPPMVSLSVDRPEDAEIVKLEPTESSARPFEGSAWKRVLFQSEGEDWVALWVGVSAGAAGGQARIVLEGPAAFEGELIGLANSLQRYPNGSQTGAHSSERAMPTSPPSAEAEVWLQSVVSTLRKQGVRVEKADFETLPQLRNDGTPNPADLFAVGVYFTVASRDEALLASHKVTRAITLAKAAGVKVAVLYTYYDLPGQPSHTGPVSAGAVEDLHEPGKWSPPDAMPLVELEQRLAVEVGGTAFKNVLVTELTVEPLDSVRAVLVKLEVPSAENPGELDAFVGRFVTLVGELNQSQGVIPITYVIAHDRSGATVFVRSEDKELGMTSTWWDPILKSALRPD